ncbi:hypothetical protein NLG97_g4185 [Lecanicillium saksenae]|uniref:Uncharacterized protein n=1 Tax=Lecanicillium saksenae TaxID=468837 RepID=A0ACC1QW10_9HYPO|nr:hypothetical protein NLG97_g4185 [Lecanicillium saksenae]
MNEGATVATGEDDQDDQNSKPAATAAPDGLIDTQAGLKYWQNAEASNDGMLGGIPGVQAYSHISRTDILGSRSFLARMNIGVKGGRETLKSAVDAGAGIGRITKDLLLSIAEEVDVVEPISKFTEPLKGVKGVRNIYNVGLEDWHPAEGAQYDLIWTQWCLGHLTDEQVVKYLEVCKTVLTPGTGWIIVKENLNTGLQDLFDPTDSSVTRQGRVNPVQGSRRLFPVRMYALKPR